IVNNGQGRRILRTVLSLPVASRLFVLLISITIEATVTQRRDVNLRVESDSRDRLHTETVNSTVRTDTQTVSRISKVTAVPSVKELLPQLTKRLVEHESIRFVEMQHLLRVLRELTLSRVHARCQHKVSVTQ